MNHLTAEANEDQVLLGDARSKRCTGVEKGWVLSAHVMTIITVVSLAVSCTAVWKVIELEKSVQMPTVSLEETHASAVEVAKKAKKERKNTVKDTVKDSMGDNDMGHKTATTTTTPTTTTTTVDPCNVAKCYEIVYTFNASGAGEEMLTFTGPHGGTCDMAQSCNTTTIGNFTLAEETNMAISGDVATITCPTDYPRISNGGQICDIANDPDTFATFGWVQASGYVYNTPSGGGYADQYKVDCWLSAPVLVTARCCKESEAEVPGPCPNLPKPPSGSVLPIGGR